jgi:hypothetical protein
MRNCTLNNMKIQILCIVIFIILSCNTINIEIEITQTEIENKLCEYYPVKLDALFANIDLSKPYIKLLEDKINIIQKFTININEDKIEGNVNIDTNLKYDNTKKQFYFYDFIILDFSQNIIQIENKETILTIINTIIIPYLEKIPIYELNQKDFTENIARYTLKEIRIKKDKIFVIIGI